MHWMRSFTNPLQKTDKFVFPLAAASDDLPPLLLQKGRFFSAEAELPSVSTDLASGKVLGWWRRLWLGVFLLPKTGYVRTSKHTHTHTPQNPIKIAKTGAAASRDSRLSVMQQKRSTRAWGRECCRLEMICRQNVWKRMSRLLRI